MIIDPQMDEITVLLCNAYASLVTAKIALLNVLPFLMAQ